MNLRKQLFSYIALNNYVEAIKSGQLPAGYTELEYIESTGTQHIDTGVVLGQDYTNTNIKLEYDALINNGANWQVCGTLGINGIYIGVSPSDIIYYGTGFNDTSTGVTNPFVKCKYINDAKNGVIKVTNLSTNTDIVNLTYTPVTKTRVLPMILFGFSESATAISSHKMSGKMYNAKIYNNNELIRHFIPAKRLSDSVVGMYDLISNTFFTNSGTGSFVAGPEVYNSSIVLTDAITNGLTDLQLKGSEVKNKPETFLDSVVAKGGTEQNGTPTPDTPIDITSNNGVLKVRHQSGLPLGYTLLDYVESSGTQYIDTGIANWNNTLEYEIKLSIEPQSGIKTYFGCYDKWSTSKNNVPNISTWTNYKAASNFRAGYSSGSGTDIGIINGQTGTISLKGNTISWSEGSSLSFDRGYDFTVPFSIFLFAQHAGSNGATEFAKTKIYRAKFWLNGELIRDFRPMLDYNNVACMFDMVTGKCFYNQGTGTFTAGNAVSDPVEIYTDGTVETIESHGKNLCDSNAFQSGYVNPKDGTINTNSQWLHTDYLYIRDAETYTYSLYTSVSGNAGRECAFYDKDKKFISGNTTFITTNHVGEVSKTFTVPEGAKYIRISVANLSESQKDTNVQLEQGSTATEYEPYFDGGTATAEMLLKVGNYQDEQEILSGAVTRNVGVKVLDGTENWTKGQSFYCDTLTGVLQADHSCYCTHYQGIMNTSAVVTDSNTCSVGYHIGSDIDWNRLYIYADRSLYATAQDFANYLAQQYAAGTPVIVIYPLNASTTETVSPQKLLKNPVTVTEASIDNLEVTTTEAEHTVPTPDYPLDIMCNNGVLKVGPNLFDKNASYALFNGYVNNVSVGENTTLMDYSGGDKTIIIKVAPNTTYTVTRVTNLGSVYDRIRCAAFTTLPSSGSTGVILCNYMNKTQANATFTTLSDTQYVAINVRNSGAVGDDWTQFVDAFQLEQGSTATQYRPYGQIYTDGTPETVTITGKNLFNESHIKSVAISNTSVVIPVKQNKTYTWSYNKTEYDFSFDSEFIWGVDLNGSKVENGVTLVYANGTYTTASYVTVTVVSPNVVALQTIFRDNTIQPTKENVLASSMQLEEGIRPTKYEEYYQVSFAPEDLLKLSDYQDVQSVLDGVVTRNVGIKVLDGTENWTRYEAGKFAMPLIGSKKQDSQEAPFATHFVGTSHNNVPVKDGYVSVFNGSIAPTSGALGINYQATPEVAEFKQWLADQYAAGTPVIVVYPLANTVEETVESRDVFITSGTNTIERNSEYVSSDGITVKYKKLR